MKHLNNNRLGVFFLSLALFLLLVTASAFSQNETCNIVSVEFLPGDCYNTNGMPVHDVTVNINYENAPQEGMIFLQLGGQPYFIPYEGATGFTSTTLEALPSQSQLMSANLYFTGNTLCSESIFFAYLAPAPCEEVSCGITGVSAFAGPCYYDNGAYHDVELSISYEGAPETGVLFVEVGGQISFLEFDGTSGIIEATVEGIPSASQLVTTNVYFTGNTLCSYSTFALYLAPSPCEPPSCNIESIFAESSDCYHNGEESLHDVTLSIPYESAPEEGVLFVELNGQTAFFQYTEASGVATVSFEGLPANGQMMTSNAYFTGNTLCSESVFGLYQAPWPCSPPPCGITGVEAQVGECYYDGDSFHDAVLTFSYESAPVGGVLFVEMGGQVNFAEYEGATGTVSVPMEGLTSAGQVMSVNAYFTGNTLCSFSQFGVYQAPFACYEPCVINSVQVAPGACYYDGGSFFDLDISIDYENAPVNGQLYIGAGQFSDIVTVDPALGTFDLEFIGLPATGNNLDLEIYFTSDQACTYFAEGIIPSPEACAPPACALELGTNTGASECYFDGAAHYDAEIEFVFENVGEASVLVVNLPGGTETIEIEPGTASTNVLLEGLPANGEDVYVTAYFLGNTLCSYSGIAFTAPEACEPPACAITEVAFEVGDCYDESFFDAFAIVSYEGAPETGGLVVVLNNQTEVVALDGTSGTIEIPFQGLAANGNQWVTNVYFTANTLCSYSGIAFTAPEACEPPACAITEVAFEVGDCYDESFFDAFAIVSYEGAPETGGLVVVLNNQTEVVALDGTSGTIEIPFQGLAANGNQWVTNVYFTANTLCSYSGIAFTAPEACEPVSCAINDIVYEIGDCYWDGAALYDISATVYFTAAPESGALILNIGNQNVVVEFDAGASSVTVNITGLESNGGDVYASAFFSANTLCSYSGLAFTAPAPCEAPPCALGEPVFELSDCYWDNGSMYDLVINIPYENAPVDGMLLLSVNGASQNYPYEGTSGLMTLNVSGLEANGSPATVAGVILGTDGCGFTMEQAFIAPEECQPTTCSITSLFSEAGTCYWDGGAFYNAEVNIGFENAAPNGTIIVSVGDVAQELQYEGENGFITVVFDGLIPTGAETEVAVMLEPGCSATTNFMAPEPCEAPCPEAGLACDDGNPETINDVTDGDCGCAGVPITSEACPIGETGLITISSPSADIWYDVFLVRSYENPVIVASLVTTNDADPVTVRIRNVQSQGFQIQLDEWDYQDGEHGAEEIHYVVMEAGTHTLADGTLIEAGTTLAAEEYVNVNLSTAFTEMPVILSQVTGADSGRPLTTRVNNAGTQGFSVRCTSEEDYYRNGNPLTTDEQISWIAIQQAVGGGNGYAKYETGLIEANDNGGTIDFIQSFDFKPVWILGTQTENGQDANQVRGHGLDALGGFVFLQEEQSREPETSHTNEAVGFWALDFGVIYGECAQARAEQPEELVELGFGVYPNPAVSYTNISLEENEESAIVTIIDQAGRIAEVREMQAGETLLRLDLSGYAPGPYFVQVKTGLRFSTKRFVVVKD